MNIPTVSLMQTRRYVTELVRSPRAVAALGPPKASPKRTVPPRPAPAAS